MDLSAFQNFPPLLTACLVGIPILLAVYLLTGQASKRTDYFRLSGVPRPKALPNFDIDKAKPRPYRPFRWQYFQHMSLKKMEPDWWLELESTYRERVAQRQKLHERHDKGVINYLPGSEAACRELMEMVIQFLCARYPGQFEFDSRSGIFHNHILKTTHDTNTIHPLYFLLDNVPEDFLITLPDEKTGLYHLRAAVSCSQVGWDLKEKIGRPLNEVHGPVPHYKERMEFSMDRYFAKMPCDKPIQRGSWGLEVGEPLYLQASDPHFSVREIQAPDLKVEDVYLRVDWQTLRRLPLSRAIVFNFKALFTPITQFREEPYIPKLLLKVLQEGDEMIMKYKGTFHVNHRVIPALETWMKEQEQKGWVPENWQPRTLDEDPFFPGYRPPY